MPGGGIWRWGGGASELGPRLTARDRCGIRPFPLDSMETTSEFRADR